MEKTKQWFFRGWVVSLLAVLGVVFFIACSVDDGMNSFDNGSVGTGDFTGITQQSDVRFLVGFRGEENFIPVQSGQLQKRNGRWLISVEWLPKYQGRVGDLEIKAVGTYLPDEIKNATTPINVRLLIQGKDVYVATVEEEQTVAIYDPILGGWVQEETKFAIIDTTDRDWLVDMFSDAINIFARNNGSTLENPINILFEFQEVVLGEYKEIIQVFANPLRAEPAAAVGSYADRIIGSWTDLEANFYLIDVGSVARMFLGQLTNNFEYTRGQTPMSFTFRTITQDALTTNVTQTVSSSVGFSSSLAVKYGLDVSASVKADALIGSITGTVSQRFETTLTAGISATQSRATAVSEITTRTVTNEEVRAFTLGNANEPTGVYRYAMYATSDVYLLISTSLDNQVLKSKEFISCARPEILERFEFSADGRFDNSPEIGKQINLAEHFYRDLPLPKAGRRLETRKIDTTFIAGSEHSYTFNEGFPASIEVYAVGAGGGGQRGDTWTTGLFCAANTQFGNGGSGGGGSAAYMSFSVSQRTDFGLLVGAGGSGAHGHTSSDHPATSGNCRSFRGGNGTDGGLTRVIWITGNATDTLNIDFGKGGHGAGVAGSGGANPVKPRTISAANFDGRRGDDGRAGCTNYAGGNNCATGGGAPGSIPGFTHAAGRGGAGGTGNNVGENGLGGLIRIVIEYPVIVEL